MKNVLHFFGLVAIFCITLQTVSLMRALQSVTTPLPTNAAPVELPTDALTIGWVGDMVPSDSFFNTQALLLVAPFLSKPDLMIGNLEGTFAVPGRLSKCRYITSQCHAFAGDASFATTLKTNGFDIVTLINNHSYDFGESGLTDTEIELDRVGLPYLSPTTPTVSIEVRGKRIGILGLSSTPPAETINNLAFITEKVTNLKKEHDIVIVIFHGGAEGSDKTMVPGIYEYMGTENRGNVELVAHTAIDAGADLVLGSGPHVLRKVEVYKEKPIAYSLGNFVGGNGDLVTRGILGITGIFTATVSNTKPITTDFISVVLSPNGIPSYDPLERGRLLIESLSK